jgi:hypothetical protein
MRKLRMHRKHLLGRLRRKWEDNIKIEPRQIHHKEQYGNELTVGFGRCSKMAYGQVIYVTPRHEVMQF